MPKVMRDMTLSRHPLCNMCDNLSDYSVAFNPLTAKCI